VKPAPAVAVVGLGLIGGSLAAALTRAGWRVVGVDRPAVRRRARARGLVAATRARLEDAVRGAQLVVLCAPPRTNLALLRRLMRHAPQDLVVCDVGSVKAPIVGEARRLGMTGFVGGHPMAGRERGGLGVATPDLFRGRPWALCPEAATPAAVKRVRALVDAVGAKPVLITAEDHDRAVAFLSHVPQVVAVALATAAARDPVARRTLGLAGPAWADMTRLARSPRGLWRQILEQNRREVARALEAFGAALRGSRRGRRSR
jgi:prephenate dehydrogenase